MIVKLVVLRDRCPDGASVFLFSRIMGPRYLLYHIFIIKNILVLLHERNKRKYIKEKKEIIPSANSCFKLRRV